MKKRIVFAFVLLTAISVAALTLLAYLQSQAVLRSSILRESAMALSKTDLQIGLMLEDIKRDVIFLAGTPALRGMLRARQSGGYDRDTQSSYDRWASDFQQTLDSLLRSKPGYWQVRYLDERGQELVRVENVDGVIAPVPKHALQNKSDYVYFSETMKLAPGAIFVSPLNLKREDGRIALPQRATLRVATPAVSRTGAGRGVVVIHLYVEGLLESVKGPIQALGGQAYLVNQDGYFLVHPDPGKRFGFDLGVDFRLQQMHPRLAEKLRGMKSFVEHVTDAELPGVEAHVHGFDRIHYDPNKPGNYWAVVFDLPDSVAFAPVIALRNQLLGIGLLVGTLGAIAGLFWAGRFSRQATNLAGTAGKIAQGDTGLRMDTATLSDEFLVLGRAFNHMLNELTTSEREIRDLNTDLERKVAERTAELLVANKELEAFSYSVSHDLRTPLRAIDGFSQAVIEDYADRLDEQGKDYLKRVRLATQRMGNLIDDLLALARVARVEMQRDAVDLSALATDVCAELQENEPARRVDCRIGPGLIALGDARLLRLVLVNLLGNAWKYTARQSSPRIEFGAQHNAEGTADFFVRDNGAGFDMTYADKLFGVFQRLHQASEFPGTGVGLATVQRIVHRHGGKVRGEGVPGQGATFYFSLPA